jgi:hypothetical protein
LLPIIRRQLLPLSAEMALRHRQRHFFGEIA